MDLPLDPFLPRDPRLHDDELAKEMFEARDLVLAFSHASRSSLNLALQKADRRDVERVAMFWLTTFAHKALTTALEQEGLTTEEVEARWLAWLNGPPKDGTLADA